MTAEEVKKIYKDLQKEFKQNDKLVTKEINSKDRVEMSKEFAEFIKTNKCKVMKGGKNGY